MLPICEFYEHFEALPSYVDNLCSYTRFSMTYLVMFSMLPWKNFKNDSTWHSSSSNGCFCCEFWSSNFFPYVMFHPTFPMAFHVMFDRICSSFQSTFHKFVDLSTILRTSLVVNGYTNTPWVKFGDKKIWVRNHCWNAQNYYIKKS